MNPSFDFIRIVEIRNIGIGGSISIIILRCEMSGVSSGILSGFTNEDKKVYVLPGHSKALIQLNQHALRINGSCHAAATYNLSNTYSII
jgi:hypothetical protein